MRQLGPNWFGSAQHLAWEKCEATFIVVRFTPADGWHELIVFAHELQPDDEVHYGFSPLRIPKCECGCDGLTFE